MPWTAIPDKIFAKIKINEHHDMSLKEDTVVDTVVDGCVITTTDIPALPFFSYNKFVLTRGSNNDIKVSNISPPTF